MLQSLPIAIGEFRHFLHNQIFAHLAERLVWQTSQGETIIWVGPDRWETCDGELIDISQTTAADISMLQLPHPVSLARSRTLIAWQMLAADRRLVQPFKQLFREVYFGDEAHETVCRRFAGRNIEPRRAYALLRAVGFAPGAGVARRTWASGLTTHLCWAEGVVSHDLFGEQRKEIVRTGGIWYTRDNEHVPPAEVDDIIISESLRAADLLTTRAAVGDAEMTSQETLALRVTLLREVSRAFDLTNIAVLEECGYAIVLGTLATYRVNLQNGAVLFEPEGRQVLLPNLQQHWQPSEDDVDTTTRILDIILLLAQDSAINDLTFLAQL